MKLFSYLYEKIQVWSLHKHAPRYLAVISFAEASFFPIPPDVMLISMGLASPKKSWYYAFIATVFSVLGGLLGYTLGHFFIETLTPWLAASSYAPMYSQIEQWVHQHGVLVILFASFTPFPYKLFTIAAGALAIPLLPFLLFSFLGRGARFFLVSTITYFSGAKLQVTIRKYIEIISWSSLLLLCLIFLFLRYW